jgi:hypothetical protein
LAPTDVGGYTFFENALIDKKCGGFMKINAAKSAGKERIINL